MCAYRCPLCRGLIQWLCSRTAVRPVQVNALQILILNIVKSAKSSACQKANTGSLQILAIVLGRDILGFEDSDFDTYREEKINSWESLNVFQEKDCMSCFLPGKATYSEALFCWHWCSSSHGEPAIGGLKLTGTISLSSYNKTFIPFP